MIMGDDHRDFSKIIEILNDNPRGMSVKQISEAIGVNRISVGHYLEIMLISGQVDMESYGQAKVFYQSKRIPMFAMMDYTSDSVLVISDKYNIIRANKNFLELINYQEKKTEGINCQDIFKKLNVDIKDYVSKASEEGEIIEEISINKRNKHYYFRIKIIPTVFTEGSPGFTIVMENITDYKKSLDALKVSEVKLKELVQNIGKFLGNIKDLEKTNADIRNPLQTIVGLTDLEGGRTADLVYNQAIEIDNKLKEIDIGWKEADNIREFLKKYAEIKD